MKNHKEWFNEWFNTPYYHILYRDRDDSEAIHFINQLSKRLNFKPGQKALDIGCGKGRHSIYLSSKGLDVTGIDISPENIRSAKRFENDHLHFEVHDMRESFLQNTFHYAFNLFTSFGYFESHGENLNAIKSAANALNRGGFLVIDYLNSYRVVNNLVPEESKIIDGITFKIHRYTDRDGFINKDIKFDDKGNTFNYFERVKAIRFTEFEYYFKEAALSILEIYGDYSLGEYERDDSDRMIFLVKKQ